MDYNEDTPKAAMQLGQERHLTLKEQLEHKKEVLETELAKVNQGIELLTKHPEITLFLDTVGNALGARSLRY